MNDSHRHDDHCRHDHARHERDHGGHSHAGHSHTVNFGRAFAIGIALNAAFVFMRPATASWRTPQRCSPTRHNLSDVLGLLVAWIAAVLSRRPPTPRLTYGLRNTSILAALLNAILLLIACGAILLEAIQRLIHPEPIASLTVIVVAAIGIVINGITAWLFASGRKTDLNIRGAYLHMMADAVCLARRGSGRRRNHNDGMALAGSGDRVS